MEEFDNYKNHVSRVGERGRGYYQFACVVTNEDGAEVYRWAELRYFPSLKHANRYWRGLKIDRSAMAKLK